MGALLGCLAVVFTLLTASIVVVKVFGPLVENTARIAVALEKQTKICKEEVK